MSHNPRVLIINNLDEVRRILENVGVDPAGIDIMGSKAIHLLVKLEGVTGRAANILKQEMLARGGEAAIAKSAYDLKDKKTDIILMGTLRQYATLLVKLAQQPLGLTKIADELRRALTSFESPPLSLEWGNFELNLAERTFVMGILNVTPDSFSDGGKFFNTEKAVKHALKICKEGADILDVGGESTRPGAERVGLREELKRVIPVIEEVAPKVNIPVSIDTYKEEVARRALDAGASMVNDISALRGDKKIARLVAEREVPLILMHMQGTPRNMQEKPRYKSVMGEISSLLRRQAEVAIKAGVNKERIIVDPGIGFGKTREHNLEILNKLPELKSLGFPICIGTSRKSFIGLTLDLPVDERLEGTAATVSFSITQGANIVRVHDVKEMVRVSRMTDALIRLKTED